LGEILGKILSMLAIIAFGYTLKCFGIVKREDFRILSNILIHITVPACVILNFDNFIIEPSMAAIPLLCIVFFFITSSICYAVTRNAPASTRAFVLLNSTSYNTGAFTMAFAQTLLPASSVVAVSLFDLGNVPCCAVFSNIMAHSIMGKNKKISLRFVIHQLRHSFAFMVYFVICIKCLLHLPTPDFLLVPARLIAPANVVFAMLSIGVGMEFHFPKDEILLLVKCLLIRFLPSIPLALICWYLLPFDRYIRLALVMVSFSPSTLFGALFTRDLGGNYALANTAISTSIIITTIILTFVSVTMI